MSNDIVNDPFYDIGTQYTAYNFFELFTTQNNSIYDKAFNSSLSYDYKYYRLSLKMERVNPNFRSIGSFFFTNNFITRTGSINGQLLDKKLLFNIEIGTENKAEPNLTDKDVSRLIGASGLNYIFGKGKNQSLSIFLGYQRGIIVDQNQQITSRTSSTKNTGITYGISTEKQTNSFSYRLASIADISDNIISHSLNHSYSKSITEDGNIFSNTSISIMNSNRTNTITLQSEIGYDKNYFKLHKIKSSIATQIGKNYSNETQNQIFTIVFKILYDIAFNYKK